MADAVYVRDWNVVRLTAAATVGIGEVWQMPDGSAGVNVTRNSQGALTAVSSGEKADFATSDKHTIQKTTGIEFLPGGRVYWDHSANAAHFKPVNDRDFYVGRAVSAAASADNTVEVDFNIDPRYQIDLNLDPFVTSITGSQATASTTYQVATRAKVGATAGWVVGAATDLPYLATLAASQTGSTLVLPIDGLRIGDTITAFKVIAQVESGGNTVTIDGNLRAVTNVAAEPTDASIASMTQVSVTADTAVSQEKTGITEVVTSGKSYYLLITATTAASTDIILQHCEITVTHATQNGALTQVGGTRILKLSGLTEAQKVDLLSRHGFAKTTNAVAEFIVRVISDGSGSAADVSIGLADDTHATDADSIANSLFCHLNANDVNIYFESDDGTTEVAATDSTIDYTEGTAFEVWCDMGNPASVKWYVDGVRVLSGTTFNVDASSPTWKMLIHVEKTSATDTYELAIEKAVVRFSEQ